MKKFVFASALAAACALLPVAMAGCSGEAVVNYTLSEDGTYYIVSGVSGNKLGLSSVEIPATYSADGAEAELPVTEIGDGAFHGCYNLSYVTLPRGVTRIGDLAFASCAFAEFTIPDTVEEIGYSAFATCRTLKSIVIPESVTSLGDRAFYCCSSLVTADIKANISEIEYSTFFNSVVSSSGNVYTQTALTTVYIPATVGKIHVTAFQGNILSDVYFAGTEEQWGEVYFYNTQLKEGSGDEYTEVRCEKTDGIGNAAVHFGGI